MNFFRSIKYHNLLFKNVLNQVQTTSEEEIKESKRLNQNLSKEVERLSRKVAKYEVYIEL